MRYSSMVLFLFCCWSLLACTSSPAPESNVKQSAPLSYRVEAAPEWTALFHRTSGWFGADGIFSIPLDGNDAQTAKDTTLLIFSDTYIGEVQDGKPLPGNKMVNNTVAYVNGLKPDPDQITFHYKQATDGSPETFFVPNNPNSKPGQYYWLGDGFVNRAMNNTLYLFGYHVEMTGPGVFDFVEKDVSLIAVPDASAPPFEGHRQLVAPFQVANETLGEGHLGAGMYVNTEWAGAPEPDGYVYVYGCIGGDKNLVAARARAEQFESFDTWEYWNGKEWQADINQLAAITNAVSNELSVSALPDGRYILVFQVLGLSDKVGIRFGESPIGPFGEIEEIWRTPEFDEGIWCYNAKAHPALSQPGELLISYNTITADFWNDIQQDAHIYRPRFIRMVFEE